jgi:fructosamine-3-kinase
MSDSSIRLQSTFTELDILAAIERATGIPTISATPLEGGMIGDVRKVTLVDGSALVSKYMEGPEACYDIEARMIERLYDAGVVPIPKVLYSSRELLLQEFMPGEHMTVAAETHAGETLARLHAVPGDAFGFDGPTLNGSFPLPNGWWDDWVDCFRETRLRHSADAAVANGTLAPAFRERIATLEGRLDDLLIEPDRPALLHGDIWRANVLAIDDRVTALIDPSTHFGHPEMDVANAVEIGGFGDAFVQSYTRLHPLDDGFFTTRRYVYATYAAIMHVFYFGDRYEWLLEEKLTKAGV